MGFVAKALLLGILQAASSITISIRLKLMRISRKPIESELAERVPALDGRDKSSRNVKPNEPET